MACPDPSGTLLWANAVERCKQKIELLSAGAGVTGLMDACLDKNFAKPDAEDAKEADDEDAEQQ